MVPILWALFFLPCFPAPRLAAQSVSFVNISGCSPQMRTYSFLHTLRAPFTCNSARSNSSAPEMDSWPPRVRARPPPFLPPGPRSRGRYPRCESSLFFSTLSPTALSGFADNKIQYPSYSPCLNGLPRGKDNIRKLGKLYDF